MKMYNEELINLIVYNTFKCFMYFYVFTRCNNRVAGGGQSVILLARFVCQVINYQYFCCIMQNTFPLGLSSCIKIYNFNLSIGLVG